MSVCACQTHQILHLKWMHFILCKLYLSKVDLEKILSPSPLKLLFCVLFSSKQFQDSFNITMIIAIFVKNVLLFTMCGSTPNNDNNIISLILLNCSSRYLVNVFFRICLI